MKLVLAAVGLSLLTAGALACGASADNQNTGGSGATGGSTGQGNHAGTGGATCEPSAEICDGIDNNCDGAVDEGCDCQPGETQPCYDGPTGTEGVGTCKAGTQSCGADGKFGGACAGEVTPADETCDGDDEDCNGQADDLPGLTCGVGACAATAPGCEGGQPGQCVAGQPSLEVCDGIDNDCDQETDESDPALGAACDSGLLGACAAGTQQCVGGALACVPIASVTLEQCNGIDDDCNGTVDDNVPGTGGACSTGQLGPCSPGTIACQGGVIDCFPDTPATAEQCNGIDDDCDGTVDDQAPCPSPLTCSNGVCDSVCQPPTQECNNACINTTNDPANCGGCNNVCGAGLVCFNSTCQSPLFQFSGVLTNVPIANLNGWTQCYIDTYANTGTPLTTILAACSQSKLLMGCRATGASTLLVAANAPRVDVIFDTGGLSTPHNANGVGWYFSNSASWGFALQGDPIALNSCDTIASSFGPGPNGNLRLCWHTGGGAINGGWRCGTNDSLNASFAFERIVYQAP